jgi:hypothetical protein
MISLTELNLSQSGSSTLLFRKITKATTSFIMSDRLSVRKVQLGSHRTDFHEI